MRESATRWISLKEAKYLWGARIMQFRVWNEGGKETHPSGAIALWCFPLL